MSTNGSIPELERVLQDLERIETEAIAEADRAREYLDLANQRVRMIRGMRKAAGFVAPEEAKPRKKQGRAQRRCSDETRDSILLAIKSYVRTHPPHLSDVPGSFTCPQIIEASEHSQATVNAAVVELRELGAIRLVGADPDARQRLVYAVDDA